MKQRSVDMDQFALVCHQLATTILINFFGVYGKVGVAWGKTRAGLNGLPADTVSDDAHNPMNVKVFSTTVAKWWQT